MNEILTLWAVLWLIYLVECVSSIPEELFVFRTKWMRRWEPAKPIFPVSRFGYRIYLANPLPGFGELAVCQPVRPITSSAATKEERQEEFRNLLDHKAARHQARLCRRLVRPLYFDSYILLCLVFAICPVVAWRLGFWSALLLLPALFLLVVTSLFIFRKLHRVLEPDAEAERREKTIALVLSPLGAIRVHALLLKNSLTEFHPLAVAVAVMPPAEAKRFASRILRDLKYSPATGDEKANETEWRTAVWEWAAKEFGDPEELVGPPVQRFPASLCYCPRCEQEYVIACGECADCGGLALRRF